MRLKFDFDYQQIPHLEGKKIAGISPARGKDCLSAAWRGAAGPGRARRGRDSKMKKPKKRYTELPCDDCGFHIVAGGEYCMINPNIWEKKLGLGWSDNLCIGCIEARLGRKLRVWRDFASLPQNPGGFENSERYARRVLGERFLQSRN